MATAVGNGVLRVASAAWRGRKGLLSLFGTTGTQIAQGLGGAGTQVADAVWAVANHTMMVPVAEALKATLALVRPVSWGWVTHKMLGALVPIVWIRAVIELLVMPFLVDSTLAGNVRDSLRNPSAHSDQVNSEGDDADLVANTGTDALTPSRYVPGSDGEQNSAGLNRASRRAQPRQNAHATRSQHPRH